MTGETCKRCGAHAVINGVCSVCAYALGYPIIRASADSIGQNIDKRG